jgi:DNA-binding transcriptional ArsR family regulator
MDFSPSASQPLPDDLIDLIARRFRVLGEPMRIKLLDHLRGGPATVGELQAATASSQQNVSKHLGMLYDAGLVSRSKDGTFVRYEIADQGVFDLCEQICGGLRRQLDELDRLLKPAAATTRAGVPR